MNASDQRAMSPMCFIWKKILNLAKTARKSGVATTQLVNVNRFPHEIAKAEHTQPKNYAAKTVVDLRCVTLVAATAFLQSAARSRLLDI